MKKVLFGVWPISATLLLNVVYFRIDTFMINYFRGLAEVGVYNFAYQFFQTALVLPTFIMNALYPLLVEKKEAAPKEMAGFIIKASLIMLLIGIGGSVLTWVLAPLVIGLVGPEGGFFGSTDVLRILGLSFPAFFVSAVLMWSMVTFGLNQRMLLVYLIGLVMNFCLNLYFIPLYSYIGASWVTVFCEYLILSLQLIILLKALRT